VWVVAPDHELTGRVWDEIVRILCDELGFETTMRRDSPPRKLAFPWGSICEGKSTENAAQKNLVGAAVDLLIWDEVAKSPAGIWERQLHPNLADRRGRALLISTPEGYNHFYELWMRGHCGKAVPSSEFRVPSETADGMDDPLGTRNAKLGTRRDRAWRSFYAPSSVNPHLPKQAIEEARRTYSPQAFAQEWEARFTHFAGQVYPEFDEAIHVHPLRYKPDLPLAMAFDFGVENPFVCLWLQFTPEDELLIIDEYVKTGETTLTNGRRVMAQHRARGYREIAWAAADPSAKDGRLTLRRHCGIPTTFRRMVSRTERKSDRQAGIEQVRRLLRSGPHPSIPSPTGRGEGGEGVRLYVDPRCGHTIREFNLYRYPEQGESIAAPEEPEKANDHCMDALRYAVAVWLARTGERERLRERGKPPRPFRTAKEKLMERMAVEI